ncbi:MAG: hypothetical protein DRH12_08190 [Deltaproteobacteria bacterium]|nr:MAG: hypothetical protein DRH12_08190 [Deltaproteobacteria bacterium]
MENGEFYRVEKTKERMYGQEKLLVCGYAPEEQQEFLGLLKELGLDSIPVVFVEEGDDEVTLVELLKRDGGKGMGRPSSLRRAVIMSGFTQENLHLLISAYRKSGLPQQLWATLTPVSENWSIGFLLRELEKEAETIRRTQNK